MHTFTPNTKIESAKVNENFADLIASLPIIKELLTDQASHSTGNGTSTWENHSGLSETVATDADTVAVIVIYKGYGKHDTAGEPGAVRILKDSTTTLDFQKMHSTAANETVPFCLFGIDNAPSVGSHTYQAQVVGSGVGIFSVARDSHGGTTFGPVWAVIELRRPS